MAQNRPLDICYPLVFFDAIRGRRPRRRLRAQHNKAIYIALGVLPDGISEIPGIWIEQTEGAAFSWLRVVNESAFPRPQQDILIAVVDGLKGFPEADNAVFPQTIVQTCIVHLIRHLMDFASRKTQKSPWRPRCGPSTARPTLQLASPPSTPSRKARGAQNIRPLRRAGVATGNSILFFAAFPQGVRRIIYTTNAIEALNSEAAPRH